MRVKGVLGTMERRVGLSVCHDAHEQQIEPDLARKQFGLERLIRNPGGEPGR